MSEHKEDDAFTTTTKIEYWVTGYRFEPEENLWWVTVEVTCPVLAAVTRLVGEVVVADPHRELTLERLRSRALDLASEGEWSPYKTPKTV